MKMKLGSHWPVIATVLFVPGVAHADAPAGRYTVSNGTVYDTKTKLTWQQAPPNQKFTFGFASTAGSIQFYCSRLNLNNLSGWRAPTLKELWTLVDYSQAGGATAMIDPVAFPSTPPNDAYWTVTPRAEAPANAWTVKFLSGETSADVQSSGTNYVRCVH